MDIDIKIKYRNDKLKAMRETAGLSQHQLAEAIGATQKIYQHYEQGSRDLNGAKLVTILKICDALSCRMEDVLTEPETLEFLAAYEASCDRGARS
ncbi:MAG: helix-turn-helix domain-containing protein [Clostridiales bacterium]|nr:helix-turn-helix domain-containing protein [Clostridiales bacterium]